MKAKVLILGGSGLLAVNWALTIQEKYTVILALHQRKISLKGINAKIVALNSLDECLLALSGYNPEIVINAAGLTSIEKCEEDLNLARGVNTDLAKNIAIACSKFNIKLVHISTDHLFSGGQKFSTEESKTDPINNYAKTKLHGEWQVQKYCPDALIIRTNFFGWGLEYRRSLSDFILRNLRNGKTVSLFQDVFFTPILIEELVDKVHCLIDKNASGVFNVAGSDRISKYEFGLKLANCFNLNTDLINASNISEMPALVDRPKDMSLSNRKLCGALHCRMLSIDEQFQILKRQEGSSALNQVTLETIPYGRHYIDEDDIQQVVDVLRHGMLTQGPKVLEFENIIASYTGAKYAVAVSSGTAALHLASLALNLGEGDKVATTANTFVATSNSILYTGAKPVFIDIESTTLNIDIDKLESLLANSKNIRAIFPVHFAGLPCDMDRIKMLADKYGIAVVEDASHALGATYAKGKKVGNCEYSDMTVFSFHPVKGIASGEGGMITTNNKSLYRKLTLLRSHGITKGNFVFPGKSIADSSLVNKDDALENGELRYWYYEMQDLGYNYRITDMQSALACSQMNKIDLFIDRRRRLVKQYDDAFENCAHIKPLQLEGRNRSSHHIYLVSIDFESISLSRHQFMKELASRGIGSQVHYIPVVNQPYYQNLGYKEDNYPVVQKYYETVLSIPLYYGLSNAEQALVINSIKDLL